MKAKRATELVRGCVVMMSHDSGCPGYGNPQCVQDVCGPLGTISLFGHNQHYNDYHVSKVIEYPLIESNKKAFEESQSVLK